MNSFSIRAAAPQLVAPAISYSSLSERVSFIQNSPLGAGMSHDECSELALRARSKSYPKHDRLFMQGELRRELFLIKAGHIKLTQLSNAGSEVLLWVCGPNGVLGILSEMNAIPYSCSAHALTATTAIVWDHAATREAMSKFPKLRQNMAAVLQDRVTELEERFRELATENLSRRLALALLRLSNEIGHKGPKGIEIALSREEMAQMTGTTLFSVSRTLSQWGKKKLLVPRRQSVLLPDLRVIESLAEGA